MRDFTYQMPVKVYFGQNSVEKYLETELKKYGPNIMLAYGKGSIKRTGVYDEVMNTLKACGKTVIELQNIPANPTYEKVKEGIQLYKDNNIDLILGVGGGSVVDCVKVICAGTEVDEDIWDLQFEKGIIPESMGNYAIVLTLSGAGAEMDCLGAVTYEAKQEKRTLVGPFAKFVIQDPNHIMMVPYDVFMPGVYDTLSHCMETYFGTEAGVSDLMNEGLMVDIVSNMRKLIQGKDTLEIRSNLMWDASLIQTFLFAVGKVGNFQAHRIDNTLGAFSHQTHGKQLAIIQPIYYRSIYQSAPEKFARFARIVMGIKDEGTDEEIALKCIEALTQLIKDASLPTTFTELGYELTEEVMRKVADTCAIITTAPRIISSEEIYNILKQVK